MTLRHTHAVWLMVLVTLLWSIAGVVTRQLEVARSFEVTFWRSFFTLLSLLVLLPLVRGRALGQALRRGGVALWLSGLCWSVMFTAFMVALTLTSVAQVLVTMALGPLFTALLARWWMGQQIALRTWMAIVVAGVGLVAMFAADLGGAGTAMGSLVALGVPVASAVNWTLVQRAQRNGPVDLLPAVMIGAAVSAAATLPLAWPLHATPHDIALLALLGLVQLAIPCCLAVACASVLKAPEVALLALLEVVLGIAWAWLLAGEQPGVAVLAGGTLVLGALVANEWLGWRSSNGNSLQQR